MKLGDLVECKITGMRGILTSTSRNLTGCDRGYIEPAYDQDKGKLRDGAWVDVMAIRVVEEQKVAIPRLPDVEPAG